MNQAIINSEEDNGAYATWDFSLDSQDFYDKYLAKYLNTSKIEKNSDKRFLRIFFTDGTMAAMGYTNCMNFFPKVTTQVIENDIPACSNFEIENNYIKYGKEQFRFLLCNYNKGDRKFEPWGAKGCNTELYLDQQTLYDDCKNEESGRYCAEIIRRNGWKIPKNYPIKL